MEERVDALLSGRFGDYVVVKTEPTFLFRVVKDVDRVASEVVNLRFDRTFRLPFEEQFGERVGAFSIRLSKSGDERGAQEGVVL